jgi:hypothetical protein
MSQLSDWSDVDCSAALAGGHRLLAHHRRLSHEHELGTIMNERRTHSILHRFSLILEVTTSYLGLPHQQADRIAGQARSAAAARSPMAPLLMNSCPQQLSARGADFGAIRVTGVSGRPFS